MLITHSSVVYTDLIKHLRVKEMFQLKKGQFQLPIIKC